MTGGTGRWSRGRPATGGRLRKLTGVLVVAGVLAAAGLAGCGSSDKSSGSTAQAPAQGAADNAAGSQPKAPAAGAGGQVLNPDQVPANEQRKIIYTGEMALRVSSVDESANQLVALAAGADGYVSADERSIDAGRSSALVTVRVPADKFDTTLAAIGRLGTEESRKISSQDVTAQAVDLDSRVKTQQASVDRIRALLAQAKSIADITSVEGELTRREADLESLKAQLAALSDQAALSSITVNLLGPQAVAPPKPKAKRGFLHGLSGGWHAFLAFLSVLLTVIGAVLPFAVAFGVPAAAVIWYLRRRARLHPRPARAPVPVAPGGRPGMPVAPPYPGTRPPGFPAPMGPGRPVPPPTPPAGSGGPSARPPAPGGPAAPPRFAAPDAPAGPSTPPPGSMETPGSAEHPGAAESPGRSGGAPESGGARPPDAGE
jgi:Domain of unknown function (DUF4349)